MGIGDSDGKGSYMYPSVDDPYTFADIVGLFITALACAWRIALGIGGMVMYAVYWGIALVFIGIPALVLLHLW